jgi:hypothetical protein
MRIPSGATVAGLGGANPTIELFASEPVWALADDGAVLYGTSDDYRIGIYRDGTLERVFAKAFTPIEVTEGDRQTVIRTMLDVLRESGAPPAALEQVVGMLSFNETLPAFGAIYGGPHGTIWVQQAQSLAGLMDEEVVSVETLQQIGSPRWDVFDAEGRFLGTVDTPGGFTPRLFRRDRIYGVWQDEFDVQYVMRLRIVGDGPSA